MFRFPANGHAAGLMALINPFKIFSSCFVEQLPAMFRSQ